MVEHSSFALISTDNFDATDHSNMSHELVGFLRNLYVTPDFW
jgi:hypothetical protein